MRKRRLLLALATVAAFALSAGVGAVAMSAGATTGTTTYPTTVRFLTGTGFQNDGIVMGQLETNSKCRSLRKVTMYRQTSSGDTQIDKILSSARGAWAFRYDPSTPIQAKFTAARDIRRNGNVVCEGDSFVRPLGASIRAATDASSAGAAKGSTAYPTHIHWRVYGPGDPYAHAAGQLDTAHERCRGLRKVRMYKQTSSGYRRVDTILSSSRGAWGFLYPSNYPSVDHVRFTVTEDVRRNGSVTCLGSTQDETF
jgi:hypothetical protein